MCSALCVHRLPPPTPPLPSRPPPYLPPYLPPLTPHTSPPYLPPTSKVGGGDFVRYMAIWDIMRLSYMGTVLHHSRHYETFSWEMT